MPRLTKQRHFEILREALALAEERTSIALDEAAAIVGVTEPTLRELLDPVLYLSFHTTGGMVDESRAFLLTTDGHLALDEHHWLRDLASVPPDPDAALRLLVAGVAIQGVTTEPTPDLDRAVEKLRAIVAAEVQVDVPRPPCLDAARRAHHEGRSLRFRYQRDHDTAFTEREVLPHRVYAKWGHWYVHGRELDETEAKQFRVDRMVDAELGDVMFDPPPDTGIPEWFDLHEHDRTVTLRCTRSQLDALPRPLTVGTATTLPDGRLEVDVTVAGERRLDYVLVCLAPDAEVVAPDDARARRRAHAARLLEAYRP